MSPRPLLDSCNGPGPLLCPSIARRCVGDQPNMVCPPSANPAPFTPYGCGVVPGAKVGNGVAVLAGVAVAPGLCVATCACAPTKKATKPTRTHTLRKAIPDRIRVFMDFPFIAK